MCAIAGYFRLDGAATASDADRVRRMADRLRHRGPDGSGLTQMGRVTLGHRRLAIIDLSEAGRQPMSNEDGSVWLVFNGEIYNAEDLRPELERLGHCFSSRTDSETLIHGYEEWGIEGLLGRLRGMFAFALQDRRGEADLVLLVRDRFGIKPLYYHQDGEGVSFASEVRAFRRGGGCPDRANPEAIRQFLLWGSLPEPYTTIDQVFSLPAGAWAEVDPSGFRLKRYYDAATALASAPSPSGARTAHEAVMETRRVLEETVRLHLISDAPLGMFLSGGIDSSALLALAAPRCARPLTTVSVTFEEKAWSEGEFARVVARRFGANHRQVLVRDSDFMEELPAIFEAMDQPSIDGVNAYFVSKAARQAGLKVMLSGLGADETFLGYRHLKNAHNRAWLWTAFSRMPERVRGAFASTLSRSAPLFGKNALERAVVLRKGSAENLHYLYRGLFSPRRIEALLGSHAGARPERAAPPRRAASSLTAELIGLEFEGYLKNQLLRDTDVMSMAHSLEVRVPYLDHVLVEQVVSTPAAWRVDPSVNKPLLVKGLGESLPPEIWKRPKMGFTFPFERWLRDHRPQVRELAAAGGLEPSAVDQVWRGFESGYVHWSQAWATVVAARWTS